MIRGCDLATRIVRTIIRVMMMIVMDDVILRRAMIRSIGRMMMMVMMMMWDIVQVIAINDVDVCQRVR